MYLIIPDPSLASKLVQHEVDEAPNALDVPILQPTRLFQLESGCCLTPVLWIPCLQTERP